MPTTGRGVDLHPYYQRGTNALPDVSFGWIKEADGAAPYKKIADGRTWTADAHAALFRRLGIPSGGYVFAQPSVHGATAFDALWGECLRLGTIGVAPACDIEGAGWNPTNATTRGREFCARARARGVRPAVYMDLTLLRDCRPDRWPEQPVIWAPRYGAKPEELLHGVQYLGHYDVHQFTSSGSLPGSAGKVDWNQAYTSAFLNPTEDDDMPDKNEFESWVKEAVTDVLINLRTGDGPRSLFDSAQQLIWNTQALLAKGDGATAEEIAAALLPALAAAVVAEVAKVDAISDADAQQIAKAVTDRVGAALLGGQAAGQ